jgi:hemolysin activation/secretion protein
MELRVMRQSRRWYYWGAGLLLTAPAWADPVRIDQGVELQRQQQEQRIRQQLKTPPPQLESQTPASAPPASTTCVSVQHIDVTGADRLNDKALRSVVAMYEGRCLNTADINQLLQAINAAYVSRGYITSRAYLPEQKMTTGVLRLQVIEGVIESISLNDNHHGSDARRVSGAFPTAAGKALRLQDIEQGIDQLNRPLSAQAAVALEPGAQAGSSKVIVKSVDDRSWRAGLYGDNSGEAVTGRIKLTATLDKDNLFEINDSWQLAFNRSERSHAFSMSPVLPFGYWTLSGSYSQSNYSNPLGNGYTVNGESNSALLNLERLFFRNQTEQLSVVVGISDRDSSREIAGASLLPDETATARIGLRWLHRNSAAATWFGQLSYVRGTDWFDATQDIAQLPDAYPHHQFNKLELQGQYFRSIFQNWQYSSQIQAQYSGLGLVGGEQLVLGGNDSLRGFATSSSYGDSGISWRNKLGSACYPALPRLQCFAFADAGIVRSYMSPPAQQLAGAGIGARLDYPNFFAEASAGIPLYASDAVKTDGGQIYIQLGAHY